jgi:hypothetical protein
VGTLHLGGTSCRFFAYCPSLQDFSRNLTT